MTMLRVVSIFNSIDGEVNLFHQGRLSTFVRLAGCNLRCSYCDTTYAQEKDVGVEMSVEDVVAKVEEFGCKKVTITGGEPLLQNYQFAYLVSLLDEKDYLITAETNGSLTVIYQKYKNLSYVMDWKLPSSGMEQHMRLMNFLLLTKKDFVKFVVLNREDYIRALDIRKILQRNECQATIAFSPGYGVLNPAELVGWLQTDGIQDVILNLQLHKYIWPQVKPGEER